MQVLEAEGDLRRELEPVRLRVLDEVAADIAVAEEGHDEERRLIDRAAAEELKDVRMPELAPDLHSQSSAHRSCAP